MKQEDICKLERRFAELSKGLKRSMESKIPNKKITAAELQAQLQQDKEYQKWLKEKEEVRTALEAAYADEEKPLIDDLAKVGVNVMSSWDLVNTKSSYKTAIPILVEHLSKSYHIKNKEGVIRALAVKEATGVACRSILDEYHKAPKDNFHYRWAFGNTMAVIITPEFIDDVIAIVRDESNGDSRQMFVAALGKIKSPTAMEVLGQLIKDESEVISKEAIKALKRQGKLE